MRFKVKYDTLKAGPHDLRPSPFTASITTMGNGSYNIHFNQAPSRTVTIGGNDPPHESSQDLALVGASAIQEKITQGSMSMSCCKP